MTNKPLPTNTTVFAGATMISIRAEEAKMGCIVTAYVNGISVRAPSTVLANSLPRSLFVDAVLMAADGYDDTGDQPDRGDGDYHTAVEIESFILSALKGL